MVKTSKCTENILNQNFYAIHHQRVVRDVVEHVKVHIQVKSSLKCNEKVHFHTTDAKQKHTNSTESYEWGMLETNLVCTECRLTMCMKAKLCITVPNGHTQKWSDKPLVTERRDGL